MSKYADVPSRYMSKTLPASLSINTAKSSFTPRTSTSSAKTPVVKPKLKSKVPVLTPNTASANNKTKVDLKKKSKSVATPVISTPLSPKTPKKDKDLELTKSGELLITFKEAFPKGEVKCLVTVKNNIWAGGTNGQMAIYRNNTTFENVETRCIWRVNDAFSSLCAIYSEFENDLPSEENRVWSGFASGKVAVWHCETMKKEHEIACHSAAVTCILQVGKNVWTSSLDGTIRIWEAATLQPLKQLIEHGAPVHAMVLVESESEIWTAGDDGRILVRDGFTGEVKQELDAFSPQILCLTYSNGNVWSSHNDGKIRVWNAKKKTCLKEINAHETEVTTLISTTKQIWSGGLDKVLHIFDSSTLQAVKKIRANNVWVIAMLNLSKSRVLAVCSDKKIRVWKGEGERVVQRLPHRSRGPLHTKTPSVDQSLLRAMSEDAFDLLNDDIDFPNNFIEANGNNEPFNLLSPSPRTNTKTDTSILSPMVSPILSAHQQMKKAITQAVADISSVKKPDLQSPPATQMSAFDLYNSSDDDDDSDEEDDNRSLKEAFEKEIVILRQQLQEATSRIGKYRSKLRTRRQKLHEKDAENKGMFMKYNVVQDELYSLRGQHAIATQQLQERDSKLTQILEERKDAVTRLRSLYSSITNNPASPISNNGDLGSIRAMDKLFMKIEMEIQLLRIKNSTTVEHPAIESNIGSEEIRELKEELSDTRKENELLKDKLDKMKYELELSFKDIAALVQDVTILQKNNEMLYVEGIERDLELASFKEIITNGSVSDKTRELSEAVSMYSKKVVSLQRELEQSREESMILAKENSELRDLSLSLSVNKDVTDMPEKDILSLLKSNDEVIASVLEDINDIKTQYRRGSRNFEENDQECIELFVSQIMSRVIELNSQNE